MSRSGYTDDPENLAMWRGQVASAIRGKRGQKLLRDLAAAMDAMPVKELIANNFTAEGQYCALGVVGHARGLDMGGLIDRWGEVDYDATGDTFDIAHQLAREIMWINDEAGPWLPYHQEEPPADRWTRVRKWVENNLQATVRGPDVANGEEGRE